MVSERILGSLWVCVQLVSPKPRQLPTSLVYFEVYPLALRVLVAFASNDTQKTIDKVFQERFMEAAREVPENPEEEPLWYRIDNKKW